MAELEFENFWKNRFSAVANKPLDPILSDVGWFSTKILQELSIDVGKLSKLIIEKRNLRENQSFEKQIRILQCIIDDRS